MEKTRLMEETRLMEKTSVRLHQSARYVRTDPEAAMAKCRFVVESIMRHLFATTENTAGRDKKMKDTLGLLTIENTKSFLEKNQPYPLEQWDEIRALVDSINTMTSRAMHPGGTEWRPENARAAFDHTKILYKRFLQCSNINHLYEYCECNLPLTLIGDFSGQEHELGDAYGICLDCKSLYHSPDDCDWREVDAFECHECGTNGVTHVSSLLVGICDACQQMVDLNDYQFWSRAPPGDWDRDTDQDFVRAFRGETTKVKSDIEKKFSFNVQELISAESNLNPLSPTEAIILLSKMGERIPFELVHALIEGEKLGRDL